MKISPLKKTLAPVLVTTLTLCMSATTALASAPVSFTNIVHYDSTNLQGYHRTPSASDVTLRQALARSLVYPLNVGTEIVDTPMRSRGIPGVALFDYDRDGDLDIYVTNGPGTPNSLYASQLVETGKLSFVDVAQWAGVALTAQDSTGVCYGDIDNDGDHDLMVVGHKSGARLFENHGGTFTDITSSASIGQEVHGTSCVMGDVNNDGRLDIFIGRGYSLDSLRECFFDYTSSDIKANDLFLNVGNNAFVDVSQSSGIRDLVSGGMPAGANTITWSAALVDYDQDGDLDLLTTDDQCNVPTPQFGGIIRGTMQLFRNDGTGHFTNHTLQAGLTLASEWMGTSWGDFNHDGQLDFFVTSFGEWGKQFVGAPIALGNETSRWYLGDSHGGFTNPGVGNLLYTPFGWGTVAEDFDNDGDTDLVFYGGLDMVTHAEKSNPGAILFNDGDANFTYDPGALGLEHRRRNDSGVAAGDLDGDGFVDIVSVSNFDTPAPLPLVPYSVGGISYGTVWEPAFFVPIMENISGPYHVWTGVTFADGTLAVELNNGESDRESVKVEVLGTIGLVPNAKNNRDGIGAVVSFTPDGGQRAMKPVMGGSSHVSQDSLAQHFGMGSAAKGTLEVLWPGGVRNRLYDVPAGASVNMPEIPCRYDDVTQSMKDYKSCVNLSLNALKQQGIITLAEKNTLKDSAIRAKKNP